MRWKPIESRRLPKWAEYVIVALCMPLAIVAFGPLFLGMWLQREKRRLIGPYQKWSPWFAWYPVRADRGFGNTVWLEWVERRDFHGDVEHVTVEERRAYR